MGFMKQMKDLKATVAAAPAMIEQSQQMAAQAQALQAAYLAQQQAAMQAAMQAQAMRPEQG